jgi:hypothetical protein
MPREKTERDAPREMTCSAAVDKVVSVFLGAFHLKIGQRGQRTAGSGLSCPRKQSQPLHWDGCSVHSQS